MKLRLLSFTLLFISCFTALFPVSGSSFNTLYTTEFLLDYDPSVSAWVIDRFGDSTGNLILRFGNALNRSLRFDIVNDWFEFDNDVNLKQFQIKNAAIDNRTTAPTSPVQGQIYYNTVDKQTYLWNGTTWVNLSGTGHTQNTDTGTTSNTFTLDQDSTGGNTSLNFTTSAGNSLQWNSMNDRFVFNNDVRIEGNEGIVGESFIAYDHTAAQSDGIINLGRAGNVWQKIGFNTASNSFETSSNLSVGGNISQNGTAFTLDADNTGSGQNVSIIAKQGTGNNGVLRYNATLKRWEVSNDGGAYVPIVGADGYTTLFSQTAATTTACPSGGFVFNSGLDSNRNNILDSGEIASTATICNGTSTGGNGNTNGGGGSTLAGSCTLTRTTSYSGSAQYSLALSGMASYTDNTLEVVFQNGNRISSISNNNGGSSSWSDPNYILSILGSSQNLMLYVNYNGTPPAGQTPFATTAKITKFGNTLNCSVVNL